MPIIKNGGGGSSNQNSSAGGVSDSSAHTSQGPVQGDVASPLQIDAVEPLDLAVPLTSPADLLFY